MKKNLFALFIALLSVGQVFGGGTTTTYYACLKAQVSSNSTGLGRVYAGTSNVDTGGTYKEISTSTNQSTTTKNENKTFYAFAKPNDGYMFEGWSDSDNSILIASQDNPYSMTIQASSDKEGTPSSKTVYAVFKEIPISTITYKAPINGSYTYSYSGEADVTMYPGDADKQKQTKDPVTLTATADNGYTFLRWKKTTSDGISYFGGNPAENVSFDKDAIIEAEFVPDTWALFIIKDGDGVQYTDLNEANTAALASTSKTIVIAKDGELIAGNYTISQGVSLLIPFDDEYSCYTTEPMILHGWRTEDDKGKAASVSDFSNDNSFVYRMLTLASGAHLFINGTLSLSAKRHVVIDTGNQGASLPNVSGSGRIRGGFLMLF